MKLKGIRLIIVCLVCFCLILTSLLSITGCTTTTTVTTPIVLKLAPATAPPPPSMGLTLSATEFGRLIEEKTNGKVKVDIYFAQSLAKGSEIVSAVQTGVADMAFLRTAAEPGKTPLAAVGEMPGISDDLWSLLMAYWDLINQDPIASELAKWNMKTISANMIMEIQLISKEPIRSVADLKGKKVAAQGISGEIVKALGGVPLSMAPPEQYEGLFRGTIDAIAAPPDAMQSFKFYDVGKYYTPMLLGPRMHAVVMNKDVWNKLPKDIQKAFKDMVPDLLQSSYDTIIVDTGNVVFKEMADAGVETIQLSAADKAEVQKVRSDYAAQWAAEQEANGLSGNKVLEDYKSLAKKYEAKSPYINK